MSLIKSIDKKIKRFKNFGFKVGMSELLAVNAFWPSLRFQDKIILDYLKKNYSYVIEKYKNNNFKNNLKKISPLSPAPIWILWWQGEKNMPEIVKACCASVRKNCGAHPVKIITEKNFNEYINLPEYISKLYRDSTITRNHFANLCRLYLLKNQGGLWLDATMLVTGEIPEDIFNSVFYTIKRNINKKSRNVALSRWSTFLLGAQAGNILCGFVLDFMLEYWRYNDILIDYALFDYSIALAYNEILECRKLIDSVPLNNPEIHGLTPLLNSEFNPEIFEKLKSQNIFFKLTWKKNFKKIINGKETFYGHIIKTKNP